MSIYEWKKLADKNDPDALYNLGCVSYDDGNVKEAVDYWKKAVEVGSLEAYYEVGIGYFNGVDVNGEVVLEKNVQKAVDVWEWAVGKGYQDVDTRYMLGIIYLYGEDQVEPNLSLGLEHICEAARLGKTDISEVMDYAEQQLIDSEMDADEVSSLIIKLKNARDLCQNSDNIALSK